MELYGYTIANYQTIALQNFGVKILYDANPLQLLINKTLAAPEVGGVLRAPFEVIHQINSSDQCLAAPALKFVTQNAGNSWEVLQCR